MNLLRQILWILRFIIWIIFVRLIKSLIFFIAIGIIILSCWRLGLIEVDSIESFDVLPLAIILTAGCICRTSRCSMGYKPRQPRYRSFIILRLGHIPQVFLRATLILNAICIDIIILYYNQVGAALGLTLVLLLLASWVEPSILSILFMYR